MKLSNNINTQSLSRFVNLFSYMLRQSCRVLEDVEFCRKEDKHLGSQGTEIPDIPLLRQPQLCGFDYLVDSAGIRVDGLGIIEY